MAKNSQGATIQSQPGPKAATKPLIDQFRAALRCGTPLIAITTSDQSETISEIVKAINGSRAFISWDLIRGFVARNAPLGQNVLASICSDGAEAAGNLAGACEIAYRIPEKSPNSPAVVFVMNAHRHIGEAAPAQAVANLRDHYKQHGCTLVLLAPQISLPLELQTDVITLDEPLPDQDRLEDIVKRVHKASGIEAPPETVYRAVEAIQGLSAFAAEQVTAMSMAVEQRGDKRIVTGLELDSLWERKRKQVEQTQGLSVSRDGIKFADLGGLSVLKDYFKSLIEGNARPNAVVFIDEIEKMLAGASGDTSGVSQDQLGTILSFMQDKRAAGVMLVGHPGGGKSAAAKAVGNEAGIPTISLDLGGTKGGIVGESEANLRAALKVIDSVSNGSTLWIATSNGIQNLPPELRRRFKFGTFMVDLPTAEERKAIWAVHRKKFGIKAADKQPDDTGWTGAEIEQACELAWRLNKPLAYAANFMVPVSQSSPERIESLRKQADGRWLSASHPGVYRLDHDAKQSPLADGSRKIDTSI